MIYEGGSLFSGFGGMDWAFEQEGFRVRWQVEIDAWCRKVLAQRFPHSKQYEDVHNVGQRNLRPVDVIFGGAPCQPVSAAGKRKGTSDNRWLWPEFARIIDELKPAVVFLENSDKICAPIRKGGVVIETAPALRVVRSLAEMGFDAEWGVVPASSVGAPHKRDRWWCVAWNVSNANRIRQRRQAATAVAGQYLYWNQWDAALQSQKRSAEFYAAQSGASLSDTSSFGLEGSQSVSGASQAEVATTDRSRGDFLRDTERARLEGSDGTQLEATTQFTERSEIQQIGQTHERDLGGVVFDGLTDRLERFARTELWAAPLGAQPYAFEPARFTDDAYDWKNRVQALGNSVVVPVVRSFAEGIKTLLDELYSL